MAAADLLCFALWISSLVPAAAGCPVSCACSDKPISRHLADCTNRNLAEFPGDLPPNVTTLSLSANRIRFLPLGSLDGATLVTSLWMAHNEIVSIELGTLAPLVRLRNFDISHNKVVDFPWEDLQNLTALQLLKMNHNQMVHLPRDAFTSLKDLQSLRLNNNKFMAIAEGTFDALLSLSHLQIHGNPYACTCSLNWLKGWILTSPVTIPEKQQIICATPEKLRGKVIEELPESKCTRPNVTIRTEPSFLNSTFYEDSTLVLTCAFEGNPKPLVMWNIRSKGLKRELALSFTEDDSAEANTDPALPLRVFNNGTVVITNLGKEDGGNYSCSATNEFGRADDWVSVKVAAPPKSTAIRQMSTPSHPTTRPSDETSVSGSVHVPDVKRGDAAELAPTPTGLSPGSHVAPTGNQSSGGRCGLTADTRYVSGHVSNGSLDDSKQYTFDFGVIALGVSETEATVRLNPLLIPRDKGSDDPDSEEDQGPSDAWEQGSSSGLYLCVTADRQHSAVQWSRIQEGVSTYMFSGLRPGTNYSLCLTYKGEDCEVQVLFSTRRRVPNLLIIISVSICLLTVSTVPLLGATCFHLVYKYRSKTYKLILKAKDQYHAERHLTVNFSVYAPHAEAQRRMCRSQLEEEEEEEEEREEGESESCDGEREADTEESVVTESLTLSHCRSTLDDCEVASEYSDRLPLGAEAVNITSDS